MEQCNRNQTPIHHTNQIMPTKQKLNPIQLSIDNAHPRDAFITFDEGPHIYTVHGEQGYTSVTTFIHQKFSHFDPDEVIDGLEKKGKLKDPTYKYYGMTRDQIKQLWTENGQLASGSGTQMHFDIECYYNGLKPKNDSIEYQYFKYFVKDYPMLKAYRTEWMVYDEESKISGSIDMVFENQDGTCQIYDWKRVREIKYEDNWGGKMGKINCLKHLPDTNFWHYSLQLNTYRYILEKNYGKQITGMFLVCLHPENSCKTYQRVEVQDLRNEVEELFRRRKIEVANNTEK